LRVRQKEEKRERELQRAAGERESKEGEKKLRSLLLSALLPLFTKLSLSFPASLFSRSH